MSRLMRFLRRETISLERILDVTKHLLNEFKKNGRSTASLYGRSAALWALIELRIAEATLFRAWA